MFRLFLLFSFLCLGQLKAHDEPTSFIDLHLRPSGMDLSLTASATDLAYDFPKIEPAMFLQSATLGAEKTALTALIQNRLRFTADGQPINYTLSQVVPLPDKRDVRFTFTATWENAPATLGIAAHLFPYDPRHRTYLNIYENDKLLRQEIFTSAKTQFAYQPGSEQSLGTIMVEFFLQGIHHIFIGPDHILFVIALVLPGVNLRRLLMIVTAFTIAHSITLGLATFRIVTPPASFIEPAIALSVIVVGINAFLANKKHDTRLLLAFCFGLIHGFGFANVLQEMMLPRQALGWSLFTFNVGVEVGQACIVLAIAPLLAWLYRSNPLVWRRVVSGGALCVTVVGSFWFFERILG